MNRLLSNYRRTRSASLRSLNAGLWIRCCHAQKSSSRPMTGKFMMYTTPTHGRMYETCGERTNSHAALVRFGFHRLQLHTSLSASCVQTVARMYGMIRCEFRNYASLAAVFAFGRRFLINLLNDKLPFAYEPGQYSIIYCNALIIHRCWHRDSQTPHIRTNADNIFATLPWQRWIYCPSNAIDSHSRHPNRLS